MRETSTVYYLENQHALFRNGSLVSEWFAKYPNIFDERDVEIARSQAQHYHFYEWLAAITLFNTFGYLSLVEQYQFKRHERKQKIVEKMVPKNYVSRIIDRKISDGPQCPDLFVYAPDFSNWFFAEVKGPADDFSKDQEIFFNQLEEETGKQIQVIRFKVFKDF